MKKLIFLFCLTILAIACQSDDAEQVNLNDVYGNDIKSIFRADNFNDELKTWELAFIDNGTKIDKFYSSGEIITQFYYDTNNRLILAKGKYSSSFYEVEPYEFSVSFVYDSLNRISSKTTLLIKNTGETDSTVKSYSYEDNHIIAYNESGFIIEKYTLNTFNRIETIKTFNPYFDESFSHIMGRVDFNYSNSGNNLESSEYKVWEFDNGSYDIYCGAECRPKEVSFTYVEGKPNNAFNAFNNIYFNFILAPEIFVSINYFISTNSYGLFENNLLRRAYYGNHITSSFFEITNILYLDNDLPYMADVESLYENINGGSQVFYKYEN